MYFINRITIILDTVKKQIHQSTPFILVDSPLIKHMFSILEPRSGIEPAADFKSDLISQLNPVQYILEP